MSRCWLQEQMMHREHEPYIPSGKVLWLELVFLGWTPAPCSEILAELTLIDRRQHALYRCSISFFTLFSLKSVFLDGLILGTGNRDVLVNKRRLIHVVFFISFGGCGNFRSVPRGTTKWKRDKKTSFRSFTIRKQALSQHHTSEFTVIFHCAFRLAGSMRLHFTLKGIIITSRTFLSE